MERNILERVEEITKALACHIGDTYDCDSCPYHNDEVTHDEDCCTRLARNTKELIEYFTSKMPRKPVCRCPVCNTELTNKDTDCPGCGQTLQW